jgi:hypothetical protein
MSDNPGLTPTPAEKRRQKLWLVIIFIVLAIIITAVLALVFHKDSKKSSSSNGKNPPTQTSFPNNNAQIGSLISYQLPANWTSTDCIAATENILVIPDSQLHPNCAIDLQNWLIKIVTDQHNTTSCNQIKVDNSQVTKHVCSTVPINGERLVKSSTTYNEKSPYGHPTTVSDYFVKTKNGVVKLEYIDNLTTAGDDFQAGFDQLANSLKVK